MGLTKPSDCSSFLARVSTCQNNEIIHSLQAYEVYIPQCFSDQMAVSVFLPDIYTQIPHGHGIIIKCISLNLPTVYVVSANDLSSNDRWKRKGRGSRSFQCSSHNNTRRWKE